MGSGSFRAKYTGEGNLVVAQFYVNENGVTIDAYTLTLAAGTDAEIACLSLYNGTWTTQHFDRQVYPLGLSRGIGDNVAWAVAVY